ncbi:MAG: hypothetical protein FWE95_04755 [Planctomycetaceae bacterium]|nr:hypothetical protein [Planctomycetaceae bacterium]
MIIPILTTQSGRFPNGGRGGVETPSHSNGRQNRNLTITILFFLLPSAVSNLPSFADCDITGITVKYVHARSR